MQALATADSITDRDDQAQVLAQIAETLASGGQHEQALAAAGQALTAARSITRPDAQVQILAQIAGTLASAGQHEEALAAASYITRPEAHARVLAQIAETLADAGETRSAARMAAATCTVGHWTIAADSVLLLEPSACHTLIRALAGQG